MYKEFGPDAFKTRRQMTAVAKMPVFQSHIAGALGHKIYVRKEKDGHDWDYVIANALQKHVLKVTVTETGKVLSFILYARNMVDSHYVLTIIKTGGHDGSK